MKWRVHRRVVATFRAGRSAASLVTSCEAFLAGSYGDFLERQGRSRPGWTWLNTLAHGSEERIVLLARFGCDAETPRYVQTPWDHAISLLALEMMQAVGDDPARLACLQQDVLVPLETKSMCGEPLESPRQLVKAVLGALQRARLSPPPGSRRQNPARPPRPGRLSAPAPAPSPPPSRISS